ncbi:MAG: NmrA family NAD(P)-binding protein [Pseudomonadota bacterium]
MASSSRAIERDTVALGSPIALASEVILPAAATVSKNQQIDVADVGRVAANALLHPEDWFGTATEIGGESLTMIETAARFSAELGQPVRYIQAEWSEFEQRFGEEMTLMYR